MIFGESLTLRTKTELSGEVTTKFVPSLTTVQDRPQTSGKATVRIVAIGTNGKQPVEWWSEKGEPIGQPALALKPLDSISPIPNRQVIFAVDGAAEDANITWQTLPDSNTATNEALSGDPDDKAKYFAHLFDVKDEAKPFQLRVGVASGEWKTITSGLNGSQGIMGKSVVFSDALIDRQEDTLVIVSHNFDEWATRVIAVDTSGNKHLGTTRGRSSAGRLNQNRWSFPDLAPADLESCELQIRHFDWFIMSLPARPVAAEGREPDTGVSQ